MSSKKSAVESQLISEVAYGVESEKFQVNQISEQDIANVKNAQKLENEMNDWAEHFKAQEAELQQTASDLSKRPNLQIKPINNYVIVTPFSKNPFQRIEKTAGGIVLGAGMPAIQKNTDTGEYEEQEQYIFQGTVVETGPTCKYLKAGDIVMWTKPVEAPIPFYQLGFKLVNENNVLCVINENLSDRF